MHKTNRWLLFCTGIWVLVMGFFCWRAAALGILSTDPAKYALNLPVPHPPLGRWLMLASQTLFGSGIVAVRLPSLLADVLATLLLVRLVHKRSTTYFSTALVVLVMFFAANILWLGSGFQASFLALGIALMAVGVVHRARPQLGWVVVGYMIALWTQVQGVLLVPFVGAVLWNAWKQAHTKADRQNVLGFVALVLVQTGLLVLWLLSNPFALADALDLAGRAPAQEWQRVMAFAQSELSRMCGVLALMVIAVFWRRKRDWLTYAYVGTAFLFFAYIYKNPAAYYLSYVTALVLFGIALIPQWTARRAAVVLVGVSAFAFLDYRLLWSQFHWRSQRTAPQLEELRHIAGEPGVVTVGNYGYDWNYLLGQRFVRYGSGTESFAFVQTAIAFLPNTLNESERAFVQTFATSTKIGAVTVYTR